MKACRRGRWMEEEGASAKLFEGEEPRRLLRYKGGGGCVYQTGSSFASLLYRP